MTSVTSSHYEAHSADSYEEAYFYEAGAYMQHLVDLTSDRLNLNGCSGDKDCRMLDIGGGTGNFAQALMEGQQNTSLRSVTVVDPFLDPTSSSNGVANLDFVKASAEEFMNDSSNEEHWRKDYHKVLLKEVAHHFDSSTRVDIFRGIYGGLETSKDTSSTSLLIITRPQIEIDYPLWDEARQVWKENQPSAQDFCNDLKTAGFVDIQHSVEAYPCEIDMNRWQSMVKGRFWSTFSNFSDDELRDACNRIAEDYKDRIDDKGALHFEDRLVFISARKAN